jgi:hypothetical protein
VASSWIVPLGRTRDYLDPQCQEALHEVDVSGMALLHSFDRHQKGNAIGSFGRRSRLGSASSASPASARSGRLAVISICFGGFRRRYQRDHGCPSSAVVCYGGWIKPWGSTFHAHALETGSCLRFFSLPAGWRARGILVLTSLCDHSDGRAGT